MNSRQRYKMKRKQKRAEQRILELLKLNVLGLNKKSRSVAEIFDSIIKPVEEPSLDSLAHLIVNLKKDVNSGSGSCCMPTTAMYSTKRFNSKPKSQFGVSANA